MIIDAIFVGLAFYFTFPLLSAYAAYQYGRSFKVWFLIGCVLPILSFILLVALIYWDEKTTPNHKLSRRERLESEQIVEDLKEELTNSPSSQKPYSSDLPSRWIS